MRKSKKQCKGITISNNNRTIRIIIKREAIHTMSLAKYKKFLKAKEEQMENKGQDGGSFKKEYTPFFNANKIFKKN